MAARGSQREYAKHRGISHVAVGKAVKTGRITLESDGKIDFAKADIQWGQNSSVLHDRNPSGLKKATATPPAPSRPTTVASSSAPTSEEGGGATLANAQRMKAIYEAQRVKLKYEEEAKSKIDASETKVIAFNRARSARNALFAAATRIAPLLVGQDLFTITITLEDELRRVAEEISRDALTPI